MAIPKVIHYCWFGDKPIPPKYQEFINEWRRICPDYEIIKWDEKNYDTNSSTFTQEAFSYKQWAFIADYARFDIVNKYGGIYLDIDVQLLKSFDHLIMNKAFFGIEKNFDHQLYVAPGLGFGAEKNNKVLQGLLKLYEGISFNPDHLVASPILYKPYFEELGFVQKNKIQELSQAKIFPTEYFDSMDCFGKIKITKNTVSTHHYAATWQNNHSNEEYLFKRCIYLFGNKLGEYVFQVLKHIRK